MKTRSPRGSVWRRRPERQAEEDDDEREANKNRREGAGYFAADIDSTWIVVVLASTVPVTRTFCPANLSGVF